MAMRAGDYLQLSLRTGVGPVTLNVLGPDGKTLKTASANPPGKLTLSFLAETAGAYRVELAATQPSTVHFEVERLESLDDRLKPRPLPEAYVSPRIKALRENKDQPGAVEAFWNEMRTEGTPYAESVPGDAKNVLATFLWRATRDTRNAVVVWQPFASARLNDFRMANIEGTDVWYRTLRVQRGARFMYQISVNDPLRTDAPAGIERQATSVADPLNAKVRFGQSIAELPGAAPYTWSTPREGVAAGSMTKQNFTSGILENTRNVTVYTPAGYAPETRKYGLLLVFDEEAYLRPSQVQANVILDNLIAAGRIPPLVMVLLTNPPAPARSLELPCNPAYAEFLHTELVPWIRANWAVTSDPHQVTIAGSSYGGLAAAWAALRHPETFGNVLSQSGSYWWSPQGDPARPEQMVEGAESGWL